MVTLILIQCWQKIKVIQHFGKQFGVWEHEFLWSSNSSPRYRYVFTGSAHFTHYGVNWILCILKLCPYFAQFHGNWSNIGNHSTFKMRTQFGYVQVLVNMVLCKARTICMCACVYTSMHAHVCGFKRNLCICAPR